jgi:hydroxymethylglutaryl-CoA reductase
MPYHNSRIPGFYQLDLQERIERVGEYFKLSASEVADLRSQGSLKLENADKMIENVIGIYSLPIGLGLNLRVNGKDHLVPMAVEEASIVAAVSYGSKIVRRSGGFTAEVDESIMIGQVSLMGLEDPVAAGEIVLAHKVELIEIANASSPRMKERGGGAVDVEVRILDGHDDEKLVETPGAYPGPFLVVHLLADCRDAMGANLINTMVEAIAPRVTELTGGQVLMRILSNLADRRASHVTVKVPGEALATRDLAGDVVADRIEDASRFAELDPYRATTHNKGIMNGVDAVVLATGNDWRAMEASAHAFAARSGQYEPLATWRRSPEGSLVGRMSLPTAVGVVGGATRSHPAARLALELLGSPSGSELGQIMAAAGLASNLAALRALATEGIQRGHMTLHARAVALGAGAVGTEVDFLAKELISVGEIKPERALVLLRQLRAAGPP